LNQIRQKYCAETKGPDNTRNTHLFHTPTRGVDTKYPRSANKKGEILRGGDRRENRGENKIVFLHGKL